MIDQQQLLVDLGNPKMSDQALRVMQALISTHSTAALRDTKLDEQADDEYERAQYHTCEDDEPEDAEPGRAA